MDKHTICEDWHAQGKSIKENIGHGQTRTIARFDTRGLFCEGYDEGNAAYVVKCVQGYDSMLHALQIVVDAFRASSGVPVTMNPGYEAARAALEKAEDLHGGTSV